MNSTITYKMPNIKLDVEVRSHLTEKSEKDKKTSALQSQFRNALLNGATKISAGAACAFAALVSMIYIGAELDAAFNGNKPLSYSYTAAAFGVNALSAWGLCEFLTRGMDNVFDALDTHREMKNSNKPEPLAGTPEPRQ